MLRVCCNTAALQLQADADVEVNGPLAGRGPRAPAGKVLEWNMPDLDTLALAALLLRFSGSFSGSITGTPQAHGGFLSLPGLSYIRRASAVVLGPAPQPVARWSHLLLSGSSLPQHVMTKSAFRPTSSSPPSSQLFFIDRFSPCEKMVPVEGSGRVWKGLERPEGFCRNDPRSLLSATRSLVLGEQRPWWAGMELGSVCCLVVAGRLVLWFLAGSCLSC